MSAQNPAMVAQRGMLGCFPAWSGGYCPPGTYGAITPQGQIVCCPSPDQPPKMGGFMTRTHPRRPVLRSLVARYGR